MSTNIDLFDSYTAKAFAKLYETFPVKQTMLATELCGHTTIDDFGTVLNEAGGPSRHFDIAMATIEWLSDTGYIRCADRTQYGYRGTVLTTMGLAVLKSTPQSITTSETVGDRLRRFVREGAGEAASELVKATLMRLDLVELKTPSSVLRDEWTVLI